MTRISEPELVNGSIDLWFDWFRSGLIAYTGEGSVHSRYDAFAPLIVDPQSATPATDIVEQIRSIHNIQTGPAEAAAVEALRRWSLPADGWRPAALLISVAARLGARGLADAVWGVVARSENLPPDARADLAYVAVQAAWMRYAFNEIASLARLLWEQDLATPSLVAQLALLLTRRDHGGLVEMPRGLATMLPGLMVPPHTGRYVEVIAKAIRQDNGPEDLVKGLSPVDAEPRHVADFRRVLLKLAAPRAAGRIEASAAVIPLFPLQPASDDRIASRLAGLTDPVLDLSFPEPLDGEGTAS